MENKKQLKIAHIAFSNNVFNQLLEYYILYSKKHPHSIKSMCGQVLESIDILMVRKNHLHYIGIFTKDSSSISWGNKTNEYFKWSFRRSHLTNR